MRRKSVDEQLLEMEREDRERLSRDRIRLSLTTALSLSFQTYGKDDPLSIAIHAAWLAAGMPE